MSIFSQAASTILKLTRKCQKCGHEQVAPASSKEETVKCKVCGTGILPKK